MLLTARGREQRDAQPMTHGIRQGDTSPGSRRTTHKQNTGHVRWMSVVYATGYNADIRGIAANTTEVSGVDQEFACLLKIKSHFRAKDNQDAGPSVKYALVSGGTVDGRVHMLQ